LNTHHPPSPGIHPKRLHLEADILVPVPGKEGVHLDVDYRLLAPPQVNRKSVDLNLKGMGVRRGVSKGIEDGCRPPALRVGHP
jgi:hypothetical protein